MHTHIKLMSSLEVPHIITVLMYNTIGDGDMTTLDFFIIVIGYKSQRKVSQSTYIYLHMNSLLFDNIGLDNGLLNVVTKP